jgi:catalase
VRAVGLLTLTHNPTNYFAETEQVAFHVGNLVPGIDVTNDPLLQARLFSYVDTQLTRLGGPNFSQIPINRPHAPVNDMQRDGFHQSAVHGGVAPYRPNSLDGGCPFHATGARDAAFIDVPARVAESTKTREAPASYDDHFSQVRQFWLSMSPVEKEHIVAAYTFELAKCFEQAIKERQLMALANIDPDLCAQVAAGLGLTAPEATEPLGDLDPSPALSQVGGSWPTDGRIVGIVVDPDGDLSGVGDVVSAVSEGGMVPLVIAPVGGKLSDGTTVQRTLAAARSVEFDALVIAGCPAPAADALAVRDSKAGADEGATLDPRVVLLIEECFRHAKAVAAWGSGEDALVSTGIAGAPGVVSAADATEAFAELQDLLSAHRVWERFDTALG